MLKSLALLAVVAVAMSGCYSCPSEGCRARADRCIDACYADDSESIDTQLACGDRCLDAQQECQLHCGPT